MIQTSERDPVYLGINTKIEPLCCRWYAWSHVISPVQHALNVAYRQLPLLRSFLASPVVHETASADTKLLGGSFVHLRRGDLPAVRALVQEMTNRCARLIRFAEELLSFDRKLQSEARGGNIDHLYESLPRELAGLAELTYDLNNHPTLRIIEELLYEAPLADVATQELAFFQTPEEERKFFLNTPRLDTPGRLVLPIPFADESIDLLAHARLAPVCFTELAAKMRVPAASTARLREFFAPAPPPRRQPDYHDEGIRVRYFGHACVLLQTGSVSILIDPLFAWDNDGSPAKLVFNDLPDVIDYVFLTHNHHDHFSPEVFLQLRNRIGRILVPRNNANSVADPSMKLALHSLGFSNVDVMDPLDRVSFEEGYIASIPFYGEHATLSVNSKHGMYLVLQGRRLVFLADSNCLDRALYRRVVERLGKADVLFIGMECQGAPLSWIYGPYLTHPISRNDDEGRRTNGSNSQRAWALLEEFGCSSVFVYAMGQEPWFRYHLDLIYESDSLQITESNRFVERCRAAGVPAERLNGCREMLF
jgi:L-ascorbate metabolism protein UlaG (beta-lactamase superfamily)